MNWHTSFGTLAEQSWTLVLNHLWQSTFCFLLAWVLAWRLRHTPPNYRWLIWSLTALKFAVPTALLLAALNHFGVDPTIYVNAQTPRERPVVLQITAPLATDPIAAYMPQLLPVAPPPHREIFCALSLLWIFGVFAVLSYWGWARWRLARRLRQGRTVPCARVTARLREWQWRLGLHQDIDLVVTPEAIAPGVWRVWKPCVILPTRLLAELSDDELDLVLLHELAHVAQRDNLHRFLLRLLAAVFWFHPLVWRLQHHLMAEREMLCDELVLRWSEQPTTYPHVLWKIAQLQFGWTVSGGAHATGANLKRRMQFMLQQNLTPTTQCSRWLLALGLLAFGTAAVAFGMFAPYTKWLAAQQTIPFPHTVALPHANAPEIPLVINEAEIRISYVRPRAQANGAALPAARLLQISARLTNQSPRQVKGYVLEFGHPQEARKEHWLFQVSQQVNQQSRLAPSLIDAQSSFIFHDYAPLRREGSDQVVKEYLGQFQLKVVGIMFESDQDWYWTAAPQTGTPQVQTQSFHRPMLLTPGSNTLAEFQLTMPETSPPNNAAPYQDEIHEASARVRPVILYKEAARYTPEAREAKVSGIVRLNAIFGADGGIYGIRIVRGLPLGLNDEAINALRKIRFQPALKDGQPVSVRMSLEYSFQVATN